MVVRSGISVVDGEAWKLHTVIDGEDVRLRRTFVTGIPVTYI